MKSYAILSYSRLKSVERISPVFSFIVEKNCALSGSIKNQPRINVRKIDAAQTTDNSVLCEKVEISLSEYRN